MYGSSCEFMKFRFGIIYDIAQEPQDLQSYAFAR